MVLLISAPVAPFPRGVREPPRRICACGVSRDTFSRRSLAPYAPINNVQKINVRLNQNFFHPSLCKKSICISVCVQLSIDLVYTLNRKWMTSPSFTSYSFPSKRTFPASFAAVIFPAASKSS